MKCNIAQVLHRDWMLSNIEQGDSKAISSVPSKASKQQLPKPQEVTINTLYLVGSMNNYTQIKVAGVTCQVEWK